MDEWKNSTNAPDKKSMTYVRNIYLRLRVRFIKVNPVSSVSQILWENDDYHFIILVIADCITPHRKHLWCMWYRYKLFFTLLLYKLFLYFIFYQKSIHPLFLNIRFQVCTSLLVRLCIFNNKRQQLCAHGLTANSIKHII